MQNRVVQSFESVSTWQQSVPVLTSPVRRALIDGLATVVAGLSPGRLRVAVDGYASAGKTTFGHELAAALRNQERPTARASMDDFKHLWRHAHHHGYDRTTGAGYYRNAWDFEAAHRLLIEPACAGGSGRVVLCAHDPLTGVDHRDTVVDLSADAVLIIDSVFAFRPQYDTFWDYRIWLQVDPALALSRGIARDTAMEGRDEALRLHRDRYHVAETLYLNEVDPRARANVVIDNSRFESPRLIKP